MKRNIVIAAILSLVLAACGGTPVKTDQVFAPAVREAKVAAAVTSTIPEWYLNTPDSNEYIYIVGTGVSRDLSMSNQKALLDAQTKAADRINSSINSLLKQYRKDTTQEFSENTEFVAQKLVAEVKIAGYDVSKQVILAESGGFRTYVQIRYPYGSTALQLTKKVNRKAEANAHAELDAKVAKKKADDVAEERGDLPPSGVTVTKVVPPVTLVDTPAIIATHTETKDAAEEN